ncbi:MAG: hypothetical protein SPI30_07035 [Prevotella sp.]|nr:hypothetical protein [Prevotella sp.]
MSRRPKDDQPFTRYQNMLLPHTTTSTPSHLSTVRYQPSGRSYYTFTVPMLGRVATNDWYGSYQRLV